jgi:hypothetical protein
MDYGLRPVADRSVAPTEVFLEALNAQTSRVHTRRAFGCNWDYCDFGSLLVPAMAKARAGAARARCAAQLHDIGHMVQMYFGENRNTLRR